MTEKEVFLSLMDWLQYKYPSIHELYLFSPSKRFAQILLKYRIQKEPDILYTLPSSLIIKLGYKVLNKTDDFKIIDLIKSIQGHFLFTIKI